MLAPGAGAAQTGDMAKIRRAVEAGHEEAIARLRAWIALPSIAAENRDMDKGAALMAQMARDASQGRHGQRVVVLLLVFLFDGPLRRRRLDDGPQEAL